MNYSVGGDTDRVEGDEVRNIDRSTVLQEEDPDLTLDVFTNLLMPINDKHAPVRKQTVRNVMAPGLD